MRYPGGDAENGPAFPQCVEPDCPMQYRKQPRSNRPLCPGCSLPETQCDCDINPYLPDGLPPDAPCLLIHPTEWLSERGNEYYRNPAAIVETAGELHGYNAGELHGNNILFELALAFHAGQVYVASFSKGWPRFVWCGQLEPTGPDPLAPSQPRDDASPPPFQPSHGVGDSYAAALTRIAAALEAIGGENGPLEAIATHVVNH